MGGWPPSVGPDPPLPELVDLHPVPAVSFSNPVTHSNAQRSPVQTPKALSGALAQGSQPVDAQPMLGSGATQRSMQIFSPGAQLEGPLSGAASEVVGKTSTAPESCPP